MVLMSAKEMEWEWVSLLGVEKMALVQLYKQKLLLCRKWQ